MKKKLFAFVMAAAMILSLAACGSSGGGKGAAAVDTATVAVGAVIIARDDMPEEDIYAFTYDVWYSYTHVSAPKIVCAQDTGVSCVWSYGS